MEPLSIPWVKQGQPFIVSRGHLSPSAHKQAALAKHAVYREMLSDLDKLPRDVADEIRADADVHAGVAMLDVFVHAALVQADPEVAKLTPMQVRERLAKDEYTALIRALSPPAPRQDEPAEARPLDRSASKPN